MTIKIKSALISLSDKTDIVPFAQALAGWGVDILSTGGTAQLLRKENVAVRDVSEYTGFPEIMDGRVKTLHPRIHGGILGVRDHPQHIQAAKDNNIAWIDMVIVNLYPFERTIAKENVTLEDAIENIDIGGPSMLRAAAKNYRDVVVIVDPADYSRIWNELKDTGDVSLQTRQELCAKAYSRTADYDAAIDQYLSAILCREKKLHLKYIQGKTLRYGENSHQTAELYREASSRESSLCDASILHGKDMSFNNYVDGDAALEAAKDIWDKPGVSIIKHTNPCGYATGHSLAEALQRAWEGDPVSAFGSVMGMTRCVDVTTAHFLKGKFVEAIIAPGYDADALEYLKMKSKDIRLILIKDFTMGFVDVQTSKKIVGGLLVQSRDHMLWTSFQVPTKAVFFEDKVAAAQFAYKACKHTKSNAIVLVREYAPGQFQVMGMGAGQPNRIDSLQKLAVPRAKENLKTEFESQGLSGSFEEYCREEMARMVLASDAFFPFDDTVRAAGAHGIKFIIQPGGSKRDADSIAACDELGIAMALTGVRHFRH